jgi:hypothetical protein
MTSTFSLPRFGCVKVKHLKKSYQLRLEQLTVKNVAKIFNLVPDTILLVSSDGTVALPNEYGHFSDMDECDEWSVEGSESTKRTSGPFAFVGRSTPSASGFVSASLTGSSKWKPSLFSGRSSVAATSSSGGATPVSDYDFSGGAVWRRSSWVWLRQTSGGVAPHSRDVARLYHASMELRVHSTCFRSVNSLEWQLPCTYMKYSWHRS